MAGRWMVILAAGLALVLGGCTATHVVYVHDATLGINLTTSTEGTAKFAFGFERETFGLVPKFEDGENTDAMTVTAVSRVYAEDISKVEFGHVVATGACAKSLVQQPEELRKLAQRVFVEKPQQIQQEFDAKSAEKIAKDKGNKP